ncbi:MAG TPA: DinB family protein [Thermoanaerobaculia bacterium]|jgi:uncharacterized damage-inducible protein DinB|nr:DinB family protein [Thermoanaerobaculia bacterium]
MPRPIRTPDDIIDLFAFGRWANDKICEAVGELDDDAFGHESGGSFGSVRGTLLHLYGADWVWLERFHGRSPRAMPDEPEPIRTLAQVRAKWDGVQEQLRVFVGGLTPSDLASSLGYTSFAGEAFTRVLSDALVHLVNHGTYHRGQVVTLLRQLGKSAPSTDFLRYLDAAKL